jgi:hypothetical protein
VTVRLDDAIAVVAPFRDPLLSNQDACGASIGGARQIEPYIRSDSNS